jgi:ketosteroid isomerase-like protein
MKKATLIFTLLALVTFNGLAADSPQNTTNDLYKEIAAADSQFFDAFNKQDLETIKTLFTTDLEFYHDKGGVLDYKGNIEATKKLFANNKTLKRELLKETLAVYPIKDYGAIETGEHKFCHLENGKQDCGLFKFMMIWRKDNGIWKMARVVSYDH